MAHWAIGVGVTILIVAVSIFVGVLRADHLDRIDTDNQQGRLAVAASGQLFVVLSVLMYAIAGLLSYGHHDEDSQFEAAYWNHQHAKANFAKEKPEKEIERTAELSSYQDERTNIAEERNGTLADIEKQLNGTLTDTNNELSTRINAADEELSEEKKAIVNERPETQRKCTEEMREYDSALKLLQAAERGISSLSIVTRLEFRSANSKRRRSVEGNASPVYFRQAPAPLLMPFNDIAELAINPSVSGWTCPKCGHES